MDIIAVVRQRRRVGASADWWLLLGDNLGTFDLY